VLKKYSDTDLVIEATPTAPARWSAINGKLFGGAGTGGVDFLASQAWWPRACRAKGLASTQPVGDNAPTRDRAQNRRVR
jgi:hypothetical protein